MAEQFVKSVEDGLKLSKRVYFGKDRSVSPPKPISMEKSEQPHIPTAPMVYAVISNPSIVDNPDVPSYQPHVHGRCDPPALIPLQMNVISVEADCYFDTAFITVTGLWRVHCVMGSRCCDCRVAIPMGEQVTSSDIFGGLLLQSPPVHDFDQREIFCMYLFPGNNSSRKVFRKQVVFVVDTSESMKGTPLENVKSALLEALSKLSPEDSFGIIAFNGETYLFSSSLELATKETIEKAIQWISINFIAGGGTNILLPLNQAMDMLSNSQDTIPLIFLITDGSVEDERQICDVMKKHMEDRGSMSPRVSTFGIGKFCNHYFLQMLALICRGYYDAAYEIDAIEVKLQRLFTTASSIKLANIAIDGFERLDGFEAYPFPVPDLLSGSPLVISGRYRGSFPDSLKARGSVADMSNFVIDLTVQNTKDIPLEKVFVRKQINLLTAQAWLLQSKHLENKVVKMSIQFGFPSEYTHMIILKTEGGKRTTRSVDIQEAPDELDLQKLVESKERKIIFLKGLGVGFGHLVATAENIPPGFGEPQLPELAGEVFAKAASNCCSKLGNCCCCEYCCCMCVIRCCSKMNDQFAIVITQLCTGLACLGCLSCCDLCCGGD